MKRPCTYYHCTTPTRRIDGLCGYHGWLLGTQQPNTNADEARQLITTLTNNGWTQQAIANATGLTTSGLRLITSGNTTTTQARTITLLRNLQGTHPHSANHQPAWPYKRRLRALQAAGHTQKDLATRTGLSEALLSKIVLGRSHRINNRTATAITNAWNELSAQPLAGPPTPTAARMKWATPMAWDDIDDPDENANNRPVITVTKSERANAQRILDAYSISTWDFPISRNAIREIANGKQLRAFQDTLDFIYQTDELIRSAQRDRAKEARRAAA